jgi:hypothetical protein
MATEMSHTDVTNTPELRRLAEEVQASKKPRVLSRDNEDLVIVQPLAPTRAGGTTTRRGTGFSREDSLWNIAGIGHSGLHDVSANHDKYLADAYADTHQ